MVGSPQVINCTVSTVSGVEFSSVMISWEGGSIVNDSRVTISPTTSSDNNYTSSLQFTYLMEGDEGTYTCNVMIVETNGSQSVELQSYSKLTLSNILGILPYLRALSIYMYLFEVSRSSCMGFFYDIKLCVIIWRYKLRFLSTILGGFCSIAYGMPLTMQLLTTCHINYVPNHNFYSDFIIASLNLLYVPYLDKE